MIVFVSAWVEVTREWGKLHNEELNYLYCSPNIVSSDKMGKNEMSRWCTAYGGEERRIRCFGREILFKTLTPNEHFCHSLCTFCFKHVFTGNEILGLIGVRRGACTRFWWGNLRERKNNGETQA